MKRPETTDPKVSAYIDHLEAEIEAIKGSSALSAYLTLRAQMEDWNAQLTLSDETEEREVGEDEEGNPVMGTFKKGKINLFSHKDSKEFDRAFKYFDKIVDLQKQLESLWAMMSPDQQQEISVIKKKKGGIAEQLASNGTT